MIVFIDQYHDRFLIELICQMLKIHRKGGFITACGHHQFKPRDISVRVMRVAVLVELIRRLHA